VLCSKVSMINPSRGRGLLPEILDGGVQPTYQNPYSIHDQNLRYLLPYLWPGQKFDSLFMTVAADTVALNISYEGLLLTVLLIMMKKWAFSEKHTQFKNIRRGVSRGWGVTVRPQSMRLTSHRREMVRFRDVWSLNGYLIEEVNDVEWLTPKNHGRCLRIFTENVEFRRVHQIWYLAWIGGTSYMLAADWFIHSRTWWAISVKLSFNTCR